jgi:hypothetical protein
VPLHRLEWQPGFNSQATQTKNRLGWFSGNLVRWRMGLLEKLAGWLQLFATPCAGTVRRLHAYADLLGSNDLLIGGDGSAQLFRNAVLQNLTFAGNSITYDPTQTNPKIAASIGSKTATVTWNAHGAATGAIVTLPIRYSIGGVIVPGGSTFAITKVDNNTFTFQLASAATSNASGTIPQLNLVGTNTIPSNQQVTFVNHGFSAGQTFVFDATTAYINIVAGIGVLNFNTGQGSSASIVSVTTNTFVISVNTNVGVIGNSGNVYVGENHNLNIGTDTLPIVMSFASAATPSRGVLWSLDNLGTNGIVSYTQGPIYQYTPPSTTLTNVGSITAPQINTGAFVAMPQAQVIAFGSEITLDGGVQDTMLVRWSDAGSFSNWTATASNQAGSYHLGGSGSRIVGGVQAPQTTLLFTDVDVWSMSYVGPPFVYSFTTLGTGCGLLAQYAFAILGRTTLWVSNNSFFTFSDSGLAPLLCPVWDIMFKDLDQANAFKVHCGTSVSTNEIWIYYPSLTDNLGECSRYLKFNVAENLWDFGQLRRTAWLQENAFGAPLGADNNFIIQQHETGYDANGTPMSGVFAETGYADIADGEQMIFVDEFIPDMKWFGVNGTAAVTLYGTDYPGDLPKVKGPFALDQNNRYIRPELRARQMALRFDWTARLGFSARLGTPRVRAAPAGSRP